MGKKKHNVQMKRKQQKPKRDIEKPAANSPKKFRSPEEIIAGFCEDVTSLLTYKEALKRTLKERDKMIARLREDQPDKFANVDMSEFENFRAKFAPIDTGINKLNVLIGSLSDAPTFEEKMGILTDNFELLADMQLEFESVARELQLLDMKFQQKVQSILLPHAPQQLDEPEEAKEEANTHEDAEIEVASEQAAEIMAETDATAPSVTEEAQPA